MGEYCPKLLKLWTEQSEVHTKKTKVNILPVPVWFLKQAWLMRDLLHDRKMFIHVWQSQKKERQDNLKEEKEKEFATVESNSFEKLSKPQNNKKIVKL